MPVDRMVVVIMKFIRHRGNHGRLNIIVLSRACVIKSRKNGPRIYCCFPLASTFRGRKLLVGGKRVARAIHARY